MMKAQEMKSKTIDFVWKRIMAECESSAKDGLLQRTHVHFGIFEKLIKKKLETKGYTVEESGQSEGRKTFTVGWDVKENNMVDIKDLANYTVVKTTLMLMNGEELSGEINILNYKRFSDYMEEDNFKYIRLHNARSNGKAIQTSGQRFLLIPKDKVLYLEPFDKQKLGGQRPRMVQNEKKDN